MDWWNYVALTAASLIAIPFVVLAVECLAALLPRRRDTAAPHSVSRFDVLVPAHNEADGIMATLQSIQSQMPSGGRLIVIADNCQDQTADVARRQGAMVIERTDPARRGKGYALNYAMEQIATNPPEIILFVDADCQLGPGALEQLVSQATLHQRPVQGAYAMSASTSPGTHDLVSECAVTIKNIVRPLGLQRLGFSCLCTGSGLAIPWEIAKKARFSDGNIVEDLQYSVDLMHAGHAPHFCLDARISAPLPTERSAATNQRRRWEHGHMQTIVEQSPQLMLQAVKRGRVQLLITAVDIAVPPLSLLGAIGAFALCATILFGVATGDWRPCVVLGMSQALATLAVVLGVGKFSQREGSCQAMLKAPVYMLAKLPLYAGFLVSRQTSWNRTLRDSTP